MFSWFKKIPEERPAFWNAYEVLQVKNVSAEVRNTTFTVLDTETTGFDYRQDRILCIGAVKVRGLTIDIAESFEYYLQQEMFNPETVKIHGILKNEDLIKISEEEAIHKFLKYIGNSVLVAHHAHFDITMINAALKRLGLPPLMNLVLDTGVLYKKTRITSNLVDKNKNYTLDELAQAYDIDVKDRHTAAGDAFITAISLIKILGRLDKTGDMKLEELLK